jgi:hypothetical protein
MISVFTEKQVEWLQLIKRSKEVKPSTYNISKMLYSAILKERFPPGFIGLTNISNYDTNSSKFQLVIEERTKGILDNI